MDEEGRQLERLIANDPGKALKFAIHQERQDGNAWLLHTAISRILNFYNYPEATGISKVTAVNVAEVIERSFNSLLDEIITWIPDDKGKLGPYTTVGLMAVRYAKLPEDLILNLTPLFVRNSETDGYPNTELTGNLTSLSDVERVHGHREPSQSVSQILDYTDNLEIKINGPYLRGDSVRNEHSILTGFHMEAYHRPISPERTEYFIAVSMKNQAPTYYVTYSEPGMSGVSLIDQQGPNRLQGRVVAFLKWNVPIGQAPFEPEWVNFLNVLPPFDLRRSILFMTVPHRIRFTNLDYLKRWSFLIQNGYFK